MKTSTSLIKAKEGLLRPPVWEKDPDFGKTVDELTRRGLLAAGTLAILAVGLYLFVNLILLGKEPVIIHPRYGGGESASGQVKVYAALWDKLLVAGGGAALILLYRMGVRAAVGRWAGMAVVVLASAASVLDDVLGGDVSFSPAYPTLFLLAAVGTLMLRPLQAFGVATVVSAILFAAELIFGSTGEPSGIVREQIPFMFIVTVVLTGISLLLYVTRYEQHTARMKAQRLEQSIAAYARELEEKALALEQAKSRAEEHALALEEEQVRTAAQARQLAEAERLKDRFFANISHEFRTPLTLILGPTRDALEGEYGSVPNPLRRQLSIVRSSGERLLRLVNDLLDLSKLDAGAVRLKPKALDIVEFLRPVVRTFGDLAHRRGIKLTFETDIDLMDLYFDPDAIEKVVYNLVSNALKFTPEKGSVRIRLFVESPDGEKVVCVAVRDTGPGVPPEQIDRIFDRFHQIEGPDSRIQEGTGLGLALVRELVELHGGTVSVDSEPGFGSEFTICLPVHHRVAEPRHSRAGVVEIIDSHHGEQAGDSDSEAPEPAGEDAPLVMVVDNDVDVRGYIRGHLESSYRVVEAENGVEALEKIAEGRPSLVICDVMMPRMDGIEFCSRVRKDPELADMPVVLLTALADDESRLEGLRAGADDYMPKPFSSSELLARVENLIEIRSLLRARAAYGVVEPSPIDLPSVDQVFLEKVRSVVEDHIQDSNFGVDWLADEVALSTRQLQRKMKKLTRLSAAGNIRAMRLKRADQLLRRRAGNVSEVAGMVGFRDAAYFTRLFKQTFGRLPSEVLGASVEEDLLDE